MPRGLKVRDFYTVKDRKMADEADTKKVPSTSLRNNSFRQSLPSPTQGICSFAATKRLRKEYYNLDAIIAVGYRVNSYQATQFRIWATKTLRESMIKGFALPDPTLEDCELPDGRLVTLH